MLTKLFFYFRPPQLISLLVKCSFKAIEVLQVEREGREGKPKKGVGGGVVGVKKKKIRNDAM